jgi:biopolymer transport protein ExbD
MSKKLRDTRPEEPGLGNKGLMPFVDVVFLLLVFMAAGLRFFGPEGRIEVFLPKDT